MTERATTSNQSPFPREIAQGGVVLTLTPDQVYVEFAETVDPRDIDAFLARYRLRPVRDEPSAAAARDRAATLPQRRWLRTTRRADVAQLIGELRTNDQVRTASPVYHRADRLPAVTGLSFADRVLVRFTPSATDEEIRNLIAALDTDVVATAPEPREGDLYQLRLRSAKSQ